MEVPTGDAVDIDIELAKMLVTAIISIILYGRQAFPENCFQKLSICDFEDPLAKHEHLLRSGSQLSFKDDPLQILNPDGQTFVYVRERRNPRLHGFLADLDQIFAALADGLVGKIYICFTNSKGWSGDSLLECYTLKFSYTELGQFNVYLEWAGMDDTPLEKKVSTDVFKSLKQFVVSCPQLPDPFYTRLFVSSIDSKTMLKGAWDGNGHGVREALLHFKSRKGSNSGRVGRFSCSAPSRQANQEALDADVQWLPEVLPRATIPELPQLCSSTVTTSASPEPNLAASPAKPTSESNVIKSQRRPLQILSSTHHRQDTADAPSLPVTRSFPHEHAAILSTENYGYDEDSLARARPSSGSTLVEPPLRGSFKKRSASPDSLLTVTRKTEREATAASKYPRLAMIEEIPEDLPPTQRLRTPSQSRQTQMPANVNPSFSFLDPN